MAAFRDRFALFTRPSRVALIGGSDRAGSVGLALAANLSGPDARHRLEIVNPRRPVVAGRRAVASIDALEAAPDLAVIAAPAEAVSDAVTALGRRGCRAAVIISAGFEDPASEASRALRGAAAEADVRFIGPNCLGLLSPASGLNASFAADAARPGRIALAAQSGAVAGAILRWARDKGVGFSHVFTVGNALDVGFPDLLDALATDSATEAVLLYVEGMAQGERFVRAAQRLSAAKPVLALKAGRGASGARAAFSHTGALAGADAVYDAAFRRAGVGRLETLEALLDAASALSCARPAAGETLAIVTNGGGGGVLAADALDRMGGAVARTPDAVQASLRCRLPGAAALAGPVDLLGDAGPGRYAEALDALHGTGADALLVINCPTGVADSDAVAAAVAEAAGRGGPTSPPLLACWMGGGRRSERTLRRAGVPAFPTPERAVRAFLALRRPSPEAPASTAPLDAEAIRAVLEAASAAGRDILDAEEVAQVLAACGVPIPPQRQAATPDEAERAAADLGGPVVLKIRSPDLTHKSDLGGVVAGLRTPQAVRDAAAAMAARIARQAPAARLDGFLVQGQVERPLAEEVIVGLTRDPVFGPVVLVGKGGVAVQVDADRALALAPLDPPLALEALARTRVFARLKGYRNRPAADHAAVCAVMAAVGALGVAFPEIAEMDINPLLVDAEGAVAVDARIRLAPRPASAKGAAS